MADIICGFPDIFQFRAATSPTLRSRLTVIGHSPWTPPVQPAVAVACLLMPRQTLLLLVRPVHVRGLDRVSVTSSSHGRVITPFSLQACRVPRLPTPTLGRLVPLLHGRCRLPRRHSKSSNTARSGTPGKERSHRAPRTPRCSGNRLLRATRRGSATLWGHLGRDIR